MVQLLPYQPSLASATNTRVDSACKHIQQCRVSTDDMMLYSNSHNDPDTLQREKFRYCVHKDECVIGIGRPWVPTYNRKRTNNAYPRVISNLGALTGAKGSETEVPVDMLRYMFHYARSMGERKAIIDWFDSRAFRAPVTVNLDTLATTVHPANHRDVAFERDPTAPAQCKMDFRTWSHALCDYIPVGFANTIGWAHPNTGDTMTSVMIGGLRTIMNGDFEVFTGDPVQWYWPFEFQCFTEDGRRKPYVGAWERDVATGKLLPPNVDPRTGGGIETYTLTDDALEREVYHKRQFGQPASKEKLVARVKPYFRDDDNPRIYDGYRVFATAISNARPHEMVDIKISRQSM